MEVTRDPQYILKVLKFFRLALHQVFGCRVHGIEKLGEGPCLLISNHNIGAPFEVMALLQAWEARFSGKRPVFGLAHPFVFRIPGLRSLFRKLGGVPATYPDAHRILDSGASLLIFPGGNYEAVRPFSQRNLCDFGRHKGWAKIALARNVPLVPISIVGSHSVNPVLLRSRVLPYLLILPWALRVRWYPITLSQIIYPALASVILMPLLPFWAVAAVTYFVFLFSVLWACVPAKIEIQIGDPISLVELLKGHLGLPDPDRLELCYDEVQRRIQEGMNRLRQERQVARIGG